MITIPELESALKVTQEQLDYVKAQLEKFKKQSKPRPLEEGKEVQAFPMNLKLLRGRSGTLQIVPNDEDLGYTLIIKRAFESKKPALEMARRIMGGSSD